LLVFSSITILNALRVLVQIETPPALFMSACLVPAHMFPIKVFDPSAGTTLNRESEEEDRRRGGQAHPMALPVRDIT